MEKVYPVGVERATSEGRLPPSTLVSPAAPSVASVAMVGVLMAYQTSNRTGPVHAVPLGDDLSLCGRQMLSFAGRPWPMARRLWPMDILPCGERARQVYDEP